VEKAFVTMAEEIKGRIQKEDYVKPENKPSELSKNTDALKTGKTGCC